MEGFGPPTSRYSSECKVMYHPPKLEEWIPFQMNWKRYIFFQILALLGVSMVNFTEDVYIYI